MEARYRVPLAHWPGGGFACLRELRGADEESVAGTDTEAALCLVDRLLVGSAGASVPSGRAADLSAADRDRLLAEVYRRHFGRRVASTVRCASCGEPYEVDFDLEELAESLSSEGEGPRALRLEDGTFRLAASGARFRLPTGRDELALVGLGREEARGALLERCLLEGDHTTSSDVVSAMERAGPILDVDVDGSCPECGEPQAIRFDLQRYLLGRLQGERRQRAFEVHRIARAYGWSRAEILALPRAERRLYADLIDREAEPR